MNLGDYLIWEATNGLLLIPTVIGLVMVVRWFRRQPVFTERDWLFLFGICARKFSRCGCCSNSRGFCCWPCSLASVSRFTFCLRARVVRGRCAHCDHGHLADCGEMVAVRSYWFRVTMKCLSAVARIFTV